MPDEPAGQEVPSWFRKWKMATAVVAGLITFFAGGVMARPHLESLVTIDVRAALAVLDTKLFSEMQTVNTRLTAIETAVKDRKSDEDLILFVIANYEKLKAKRLVQAP